MRNILCRLVCGSAVVLFLIAMIKAGWLEVVLPYVLAICAAYLALKYLGRFLRWFFNQLAPLVKWLLIGSLVAALILITLPWIDADIPQLFVASALLFVVCGILLSRRPRAA